MIKAIWISLVSNIVPECSNMVVISTDQLSKWMAPPNEPEVKVAPDQRKDHEHCDNLARSGKQTVHMRAGSFHGIAHDNSVSRFGFWELAVTKLRFVIAAWTAAAAGATNIVWQRAVPARGGCNRERVIVSAAGRRNC